MDEMGKTRTFFKLKESVLEMCNLKDQAADVRQDMNIRI
jgi:hypothetical protein